MRRQRLNLRPWLVLVIVGLMNGDHEAVYSLQRTTIEIAPERELHPWFRQIVAEGTGHVFGTAHNEQGRTLDAPPALLPSGWAAFLYLYNLR
jgi:hypothetical protein